MEMELARLQISMLLPQPALGTHEPTAKELSAARLEHPYYLATTHMQQEPLATQVLGQESGIAQHGRSTS